MLMHDAAQVFGWGDERGTGMEEWKGRSGVGVANIVGVAEANIRRGSPQPGHAPPRAAANHLTAQSTRRSPILFCDSQTVRSRAT